jgi:hypothetical protein
MSYYTIPSNDSTEFMLFPLSVKSNDSVDLTLAPVLLSSPENLSVSNITGTSADITWSDENNNEAGFNTYISSDGGDTWSTISSNLPPDSESDSISGLTNGERYLVRVEVFNGAFAYNDAVDVSGTLEITNTRTVLYTTRIEI